MNIFKLAAVAAIVVSGFSLPAAAQDHHGDRGDRDRMERHDNDGDHDRDMRGDNGRHDGWNNGRHRGWRNHHRHCRWTWRHHHRVRVCWR